ncbi:hypothetical protein [Nocardia nepalensis]|uniref:hypothetical protein n=1 Tax=Nocardia nepalensis TaxID=3375448 RepID=UPI003B67C7A8
MAGIWAGLAWQGTGRLPLLISGAFGLLLGVFAIGGHRFRPDPGACGGEASRGGRRNRGDAAEHRGPKVTSTGDSMH